MREDYTFNVGDAVTSFRGHDRNKVLIITSVGEEEVTVADGDTRPIAKNKRKNIKHVKFVAKTTLEEGIISGSVTDAMLRNEIKRIREESEIKKHY